MSPSEVLHSVMGPAFALLPGYLNSHEAQVQMLASGKQESEFLHRRQFGGGPARGLWQFELGTSESRGGVWGVYLHHASHELLRQVCRYRDVQFDPHTIYDALESDDILAACVARLLLLTDAKALPKTGETEDSWLCYLRNWRPGAPRIMDWPGNYQAAMLAVFPPKEA